MSMKTLEVKLVKPVLSNSDQLEYDLPEGMKLDKVFDFNGFGEGLSVAFSYTQKGFRLPYSPYGLIIALGR